MEEEREAIPAPEDAAPASPPEAEEGRGAGGEDRGAFLRRDAQTFREKYPDVDILELEKRPGFRKFCGSRLYKESAAELYQDYLDFTRGLERQVEARAADRRGRSTGAGGGSAADGLSPQQQRDLEAWNRAFPGMKMTAKEFKAR